ncbi:MAG TPA: glycerol kinase GlpK [Ktedonobacterales bacterium]|nr:glycerol kinase GlpK [Ktedonobacterales bacterium]
MKRASILALDQGTTNTKALLIDESGVVLSRASQPIRQVYPRPAWVEQDALEIWYSVQAVIDACLDGQETGSLRALAISNQREAILLWERQSGRPLGPCISWQCRRTADMCEQLKAQGLEPLIRERTGLMIDPLFSATKARWLLDQVEAGQQRAERGDVCLGTVDSWLLWNLSGGTVHGTDVSNAARTQLFNIFQVQWDSDLLNIFGVPQAALPVVRPSGAVHGSTVELGKLPPHIPIASLIGDSHAALFGQAGFRPGVIKATYGTGSSLMTPLDALRVSGHGLATTIAWAREGAVTYALEGNISVTGAAIQWLGQFLGLPNPAQDITRLAASVADAGGLYFVPALVGLGAPHWAEAARGLMTGFTQGSTVAHLARATLESVAYQIRDVFEAMEAETSQPLHLLLADGGASRSNLLMQLQADMLGRPVLRSASPEVSALGGAYLAGLSVGVWSTEAEIAQLVPARQRFEPQTEPTQRESRYAGWRRALKLTILGSTESASTGQKNPDTAKN